MSDFGALVDLTDEDILIVLRWRNEPRVRSNMYTTHLISEAEHLAWWEKTKNSNDKYYLFKRRGVPLGVVAFTKVDEIRKHAMWAFYTAPNVPRGTGSLMEFLALEHAFNVLGLNRLYCEVLDFNVSVIGMHKKFGFKEEGILREHHKSGGEFYNIHFLGILNREWCAVRDTMRERLSKLG